MRTFLTPAPWLQIGSAEVLSILTQREDKNCLLVRDHTGHAMELPATYQDFQKQKQLESIGRFFFDHPDAKLQEVDGEFRYTYTANGIEQQTRFGNSPQQALILATS